MCKALASAPGNTGIPDKHVLVLAFLPPAHLECLVLCVFPYCQFLLLCTCMLNHVLVCVRVCESPPPFTIKFCCCCSHSFSFTLCVSVSQVSYQLSLSETPIGHFEVLSFNISESGFIPQEEGSGTCSLHTPYIKKFVQMCPKCYVVSVPRVAFSVLFPCAADADGIGSLQVTLQLVTSVTTNITFSFDKCCQSKCI